MGSSGVRCDLRYRPTTAPVRADQVRGQVDLVPASFSRRLAATYIFRPAAALAMAASAARAAAPPSVRHALLGQAERGRLPGRPPRSAFPARTGDCGPCRPTTKRPPRSAQSSAGPSASSASQAAAERGDKNQRKSERHAFHRISPVRSLGPDHIIGHAVLPSVLRVSKEPVGGAVVQESLAITDRWARYRLPLR